MKWICQASRNLENYHGTSLHIANDPVFNISYIRERLTMLPLLKLYSLTACMAFAILVLIENDTHWHIVS